MATTDSDMRREAIRRTLTQRTGGAPDASAIAEATLSTWRQMAARLAPLIGERGVDVLFGRSLHLTSKAFPWLAIAGDHADSAAALASLQDCFETRETAASVEASYALLETFTELLASLIGESLTGQLLDPVWAPPLPVSEKETAP